MINRVKVPQRPIQDQELVTKNEDMAKPVSVQD